MGNDWRNELATEEQTEKLRFFGCTWDEGITAGQASDALEECARQFPAAELAYQNRPATPEQLQALESFGLNSNRQITYREAAELVQSGKLKNAARQIVITSDSQQITTDSEYPPEPKRSDAKYLAWDNAAGQEYGFQLDHLRWEEDIARIKADKTPTKMQSASELLAEFNGGKSKWRNLFEARKQSEEVTIQEAAKPQTSTPSEYTIPAREVQGFANQPARDTVRIIWPKLEPHLKGLKSQDKYVRKIAAVALGRSKDPLAVNPLISCLADSDWGVRMQAAQSLGDLGSPEALEPLIEALKDTEPYIRKAACDALGQIKNAGAIDALAALALDETKDWVRQAAALALARIKGKTPAHSTAGDYSHDRYTALEPVKDMVSAFAGQKLLKSCASSDNCYWLPMAKAATLAQVSAESKFTIGQSRQIAHKLQWAGYCVEPDARFGGGTYDWHQTIGVFKSCDNDSTEPSSAYLGAANLLRLCVLVAAADGQIDEAELDVFRQVIENQLELTQTDHQRLQILEKLLVQDHSSASKTLAKVAKSIPSHKRQLIGKVLVRVAAADGVITKDELRALERIFKAFEISQETLENLMVQACPPSRAGNFQKSESPSIPVNREYVASIEAELKKKREWEEWVALQERIAARQRNSSPNPTPQGFALDMDKVYAITNETKEVVGILSVLMADEPETSIALPQRATVPPAAAPENSDAGQVAPPGTRFSGLEAAFQPVLERLLARDSWPLADFNALAREFQFMPLNIHDTLNEWSDEVLGDFILDGEDPVIVHRELMAQEQI